MKQSVLFTKAEHSFPKDETSLNAKLLTRGGFIYKLSAGVYAFLPLGWRVIEKICAIVREEMNAIGGQELFMPALVEKKYLETTNRWGLDVGFEVKGKNEKQSNFTLGWTHEEVLTAIAAKFIRSYKDLPFSAYQIQTKFRNELRAQSGLLRGREFMMKDLYSFHASEKDLFSYYEKVKQAYMNIFKRCGVRTFYTLASGGDFTMSNTHEFQALAEVGEDTIFLCDACVYAENSDISKLQNGEKCPKCKETIREKRSIEVGNIFPLGTKYSDAFGLVFVNKKGEKEPVVMGSYGIGISRLMGTIVELYNDEKGIVWPESVAPFSVHLLELNGASAKAVYADLQKTGVQVLYDDREITAGEKFAEADLIGIPLRFVVSPQTGTKIEVKKRGEKKVALVSVKEAHELAMKGI